jgi:hypothetical protein
LIGYLLIGCRQVSARSTGIEKTSCVPGAIEIDCDKFV